MRTARIDADSLRPERASKPALEVRSVIHYRPFRNPDPPLVAEVWNASLVGPRIPPSRTGRPASWNTSCLPSPQVDPEGPPCLRLCCGAWSCARPAMALPLDPSVGIVGTLGSAVAPPPGSAPVAEQDGRRGRNSARAAASRVCAARRWRRCQASAPPTTCGSSRAVISVHPDKSSRRWRGHFNSI